MVQGIKACLNEKFGHTDVDKASYAVQGLGHVGSTWSSTCASRAKVYVTDINKERVEQCVELGAEAVKMDDIYMSMPRCTALRARRHGERKEHPAIQVRDHGGAANNQLATDACGDELYKRGILYAPDYAIKPAAS